MTVYAHLGPDVLWFGLGALGLLLWIAAACLTPAFRNVAS
jgi:hypothetical protein